MSASVFVGVFQRTRLALKNLTVRSCNGLKLNRFCVTLSQERGCSSTASRATDERLTCGSGQTGIGGRVPEASMIKPVLPYDLRPNGIVQGKFLVELITEVATVASTRYCNQREVTDRRGPTFCSLSSVDKLEFFQPLVTPYTFILEGSVVATSDHLLMVEVSVERNFVLTSDAAERTNLALVVFEATSHDLSRPHRVSPIARRSGDLYFGHNLRLRRSKEFDHHPVNDLLDAIPPDDSSVCFIHPYDTCARSYCRPDFLYKLMEEHGIIMASRLTKHDVATVHVSKMLFHQKISPGCVAVVLGCVVSTAEGVLTMHLTVDTLSGGATKLWRCRAAEALISYVAINSKKEIIPTAVHQISAEQDPAWNRNGDEIAIKPDVIHSHIDALKNLTMQK